jgi:AcrR family transcriptional regulator
VPRRNADTREDIRAVALELFVENGFEQTSLRQIAERLGITKAALYYHFPSKDELLAELAQPLIDDLDGFFAHVREVGPGDPEAILRRYLELCHRHRKLFQSVLHDPTVLARLGTLTQVLYRPRGRPAAGRQRPARRPGPGDHRLRRRAGLRGADGRRAAGRLRRCRRRIGGAGAPARMSAQRRSPRVRMDSAAHRGTD